MNSIIDSFTEFWEVLTGVFDDNKSKLIRLSCFTLLAFGIAWAAINYFKADRIADTDVEFYSPSENEPRGDSAALKKMANLARAVQDMKQGGEAIASAIRARHSKPFNTEGYNEMGLESLGEGGAVLSQADLTALQIPEEISISSDNPAAPEILVRAVMLTDKSARAIIDTAAEKNKIIKRGENIDGLGRVTRIRRNGITVRINKQNVDFNVAALPKTPGKKEETKKSNLGMEQFLFEGTVPKDSPLAPTTERAN